MSRWFRHYSGMMRDEKLVSAAVRSKQPVERVVWVWGAILESAAEICDAGRYELDASEVSYFLRVDEADILSILSALTASGRLAENTVVNWSDRQYESDASTKRQAAYRERQRSKRSNGDVLKTESDVTPPSRDGEVTPPWFFESSCWGFDFRRSLEWREIRRRIFARDDFTCVYCGERGGRMECDHIIPVALGGPHHDTNLATACRPCNRSKGQKSLQDWQH
jgi:HNH endonuclease